MHTKNLFKRFISITLAIALTLGVLPFIGGRLLKAAASDTVKTYAELVAALTPQDPAQPLGDVNIVLGADIVVEAPITIKNTGVCKISGGDEKYTLTSGDALLGSMLTVDTGSTVILTDVTFEDAKVNSELLLNNGTLILDGVSAVDNELTGNVVTNNGEVYVNNSTFAGNETTSTGSAENLAVISSYGTGKSVVLNTTIAGNDKVGIKSELNTSTNIANSLVVSNFYSGTEKDLELEGTDLVAYTVYGTLSGGGNCTTDKFVEEIDGKHMFNAYDEETGKPLVYDGVVYLNYNAKVYRNYGTATYFDYSDPAAVIAGYATIDEATGEQKNVLLTVDGNVDSLNSYKVSKYQTGVERSIQVGSQAAVGAANYDRSRYYTLKIRESEHGEITGNIQKVYREGTRVRLQATADEDYKLIRWINETDSANRRELATETEYTFTINSNFVISAAFEKLATASVTLTVNGENWADQRVELYQFGKVQTDMELTYSTTTQRYEGTVYTGTYDIYVNGFDSGFDLVVDESGASRETVKYASVKYSANGGSGTVPNSKTVPVGAKIILGNQGNLSLAEHNFTGWTIEGDLKGAVYAGGSEFIVEKETVLLANWEPIYADAKVIVNLNDKPSGNFTVVFRSKSDGKTFSTAYSDGAFSARVDSGAEYDVLINSEVVATLDSDELIGKEFNYYSVTYYGNGNTDGQSEIEKTVLGGTDYELIGNNYTKIGHYFEGWNTSEYGSGTIKKPGDIVVIREETDFYADWDVQNYLVTYDVNGGDELTEAEKTKYIDYDSRYGTLPTPTRTGYKFLYWTYQGSPVYADSLMGVAADHTLIAQWTPIVYEITAPRGDGLNFAVTPESGVFTADYGTDYKFTLTPKDGYSVANAVVTVTNSTEAGAEKVTLEAVDGVYTIPQIDADKTISVSGVEDTLAPAIEINITEDKWNSFINTITFGKFFKATQNVIITASDAGVGLQSLEYYVGEAMSLEELQAVPAEEWITIRTGENFNIDPNAELVVYAKASDYNDNLAYVCSDGIVLDETAPVIKGISADGLYDLDEDETYVAPITIKVTDEYLGTVTVDGIERTPDQNGELVVAGSDKPVDVIAVDMAGNSTSYALNVIASTSVPDGDITDEVVNNALGISMGLGTTGEDIKNMVITEDDKYAADCGEDINVLVKMNGEEVVPEDDKETATAAANERGYTIVKWLDITLIKEYLSRGTEEQIHETPAAITFVFDVPEEFKNTDPNVVRTYFVGRVHGDENEFTWLADTDTNADTVSVKTDRFSTYVLAYADAENEVTTQTTPIVDPEDEPTSATPNNNTNTPTDTQIGTNTDTGADAGTGSGSGATTDREYLADTGDRTPILFTAGCLLAGFAGFFYFDRKRKTTKAEVK